MVISTSATWPPGRTSSPASESRRDCISISLHPCLLPILRSAALICDHDSNSSFAVHFISNTDFPICGKICARGACCKSMMRRRPIPTSPYGCLTIERHPAPTPSPRLPPAYFPYSLVAPRLHNTRFQPKIADSPPARSNTKKCRIEPILHHPSRPPSELRARATAGRHPLSAFRIPLCFRFSAFPRFGISTFRRSPSTLLVSFKPICAHLRNLRIPVVMEMTLRTQLPVDLYGLVLDLPPGRD